MGFDEAMNLRLLVSEIPGLISTTRQLTIENWSFYKLKLATTCERRLIINELA